METCQLNRLTEQWDVCGRKGSNDELTAEEKEKRHGVVSVKKEGRSHIHVKAFLPQIIRMMVQ